MHHLGCGTSVLARLQTGGRDASGRVESGTMDGTDMRTTHLSPDGAGEEDLEDEDSVARDLAQRCRALENDRDELLRRLALFEPPPKRRRRRLVPYVTGFLFAVLAVCVRGAAARAIATVTGRWKID